GERDAARRDAHARPRSRRRVRDRRGRAPRRLRGLQPDGHPRAPHARRRGARPRRSRTREPFGPRMANLASPLFGGLPATGAIARTAVNVRAGARTRVASIVHAVVLVVVVLAAAGLVSRIPLAALAGVLMVTAVRMVERHNVRAVLMSTRSDALVLGVT